MSEVANLKGNAKARTLCFHSESILRIYILVVLGNSALQNPYFALAVLERVARVWLLVGVAKAEACGF
jgi:hypothetical protein